MFQVFPSTCRQGDDPGTAECGQQDDGHGSCMRQSTRPHATAKLTVAKLVSAPVVTPMNLTAHLGGFQGTTPTYTNHTVTEHLVVAVKMNVDVVVVAVLVAVVAGPTW